MNSVRLSVFGLGVVVWQDGRIVVEDSYGVVHPVVMDEFFDELERVLCEQHVSVRTALSYRGRKSCMRQWMAWNNLFLLGWKIGRHKDLELGPVAWYKEVVYWLLGLLRF